MPAWCGIQHGSKSPLMQNQLFEAALGIAKPWCVRGIDFDAARKVLTIGIDFVAGSRFAAPVVDESWHRVHAICSRYVDLAVAQADLSAVSAVAIDETSCRRGHDYLTIAAEAAERKVVFVTKGRDATTIARFAEHLAAHRAQPEQVTTVSIDMSPAFIRGVADHLPRARITFDKFHVVAHASAALDQTRRLEQRSDPSLKGLRWT